VELMVHKLKRLSADTQEALKQAACLGNQSELAALALVHGRPQEETRTHLAEAVHEGLLLCRGTSYRFLHDRVQQAAHSLIPEDERARVHLAIGRLFLAHTPPERIEESVFDLVNNLNAGVELVTDPQEREAIAWLNLRAGRRAKAAIAYAGAHHYLALAAGLLADDAWSHSHAQCFALHLELAECEYLIGNFERADELFKLLLERAASRHDRGTAYGL